MSHLQFAPWLTEGSNSAPADRPSHPSESIASLIGLVVLMKQARDDQRLLGVITASTVSENVRWFWIVGNGIGRWLHERHICDWEPVCPHCRTRRWWWTEEEVIQCGTCHPSTPDWVEFWRLLAALTSGLLPHDEQTAVVLSLLETADHAYASNDWPTCQQALARIRTLQYQRLHP